MIKRKNQVVMSKRYEIKVCLIINKVNINIFNLNNPNIKSFNL